MTGQAKIIVRGKVEERPPGDFDACSLGRIQAPQLTIQILFANGGQAPLELVIE